LYINAQQTCEGIVKIYFMPDVSEIPETYVFTKLTLDIMGLKITTLSQEPVNHLSLWNWKSFIKLVKILCMTMEHSVKDIAHGGFYNYFSLGILSLCTESWNGTRCMRISP